MQRLWFVLLAALVLLSPNAWAQTTTVPSAPSATPPVQDPQAVSVLNQALAAAGGVQAVAAITDYTATGTITYHWTEDVQGPTTVRALGLNEVRVDADLPKGERSWSIQDGQTSQKNEDGVLSQFPPTYVVPSSDAFPYYTPLFPVSMVEPYSQIRAVLNNSLFSISYKGIVQINGSSAYDIQIQRILPSRATSKHPTDAYHTRDLFIDVPTFRVVMTQDTIPKNIVRQTFYSGYTAVAGISLPFSVSEILGGQHTWDMQIQQINLNTGVQDSAFAIQ